MFWHPSIFRKTPETTPKTHVEGKFWPKRGSLAPVDLNPNNAPASFVATEVVDTVT